MIVYAFNFYEILLLYKKIYLHFFKNMNSFY